jgi:hypothetical protein
VEHYEISAYGTALTIAEQCGLQECVDLLAETLEEEEAADESLTGVAEGIYAEVGGQGLLAEDPTDAEDDEDEMNAGMAAVGSAGGGAAKKTMKR